MGTRAMILLNGQPLLTTQNDGSPQHLGKRLSSLTSESEIENILKAADDSTITFARRDLLEDYEGMGSIRDIEIYDDWPEWEYDLRPDRVYFRELIGTDWSSWKRNPRRKTVEFLPLPKKWILEYEADGVFHSDVRGRPFSSKFDDWKAELANSFDDKMAYHIHVIVIAEEVRETPVSGKSGIPEEHHDG